MTAAFFVRVDPPTFCPEREKYVVSVVMSLGNELKFVEIPSDKHGYVDPAQVLSALRSLVDSFRREAA